jgi:hypothetical protein
MPHFEEKKSHLLKEDNMISRIPNDDDDQPLNRF